MKKSEVQDLRDKSIEELEAAVVAAREELFKGRFKQATEGQGLGVQARNLRRQVARLLTVINEKKAAAASA